MQQARQIIVGQGDIQVWQGQALAEQHAEQVDGGNRRAGVVDAGTERLNGDFRHLCAAKQVVGVRVFLEKEIEAVEQRIADCRINLSVELEQWPATHYEEAAVDHHGHAQVVLTQDGVDRVDVELFEITAALRADLLPVLLLWPTGQVVDGSQLGFARGEFGQGGVVQIVEDVLHLNRAGNRVDEMHKQAEAGDTHRQCHQHAEAGHLGGVVQFNRGDQQQREEDGAEVETEGLLMAFIADQAGYYAR